MESKKYKMRNRLMNKVLASGLSPNAYRAISKSLDDKTYNGQLAEFLETLDRDQFDSWMSNVYLPHAQKMIDEMSTRYPDEKESLGKKAAALQKVLDPWTRERFLNAMLRKAKKDTMPDGSIKEEPAHIGHIGPLDRNLLRAEGLDDDEIKYYANKFSQEYLQDRAKRIMSDWNDSLATNREMLAARVPDEMIDSEEHPILSKLNPVIGAASKIFAPEVVAETKQAMLEGRDPNYMKAALKDAAIGAASMVIPGKIGGKVAAYAGARLAPKAANWLRGISKSARVAPMAAKGVPLAADAVAEGVTDAGIELGRQAMSDYYDMDFANAGKTGMVSATVPSVIKGGIALGSQVPGLTKIAQPIAKHVKGVDLDPKEIEQAMADQLVMDAKEQTAAVKGTRGKERALANEYKRDKVGQLADFVNQHPNRAGYVTNLTVDETDRLLNKGGKGLDKVTRPPTRDEFKQMIWNKTHKEGAESDFAAEAIERFKKQWPEHYKAYNNIADPSWAYKAGNIADQATYLGARMETARQRNDGRLAPSPELKKAMETDPNMIRQWKANFTPPNGTPEAALYREWKQKYGKSEMY